MFVQIAAYNQNVANGQSASQTLMTPIRFSECFKLILLSLFLGGLLNIVVHKLEEFVLYAADSTVKIVGPTIECYIFTVVSYDRIDP